MAARRGVLRSIGLGLITGAADDDPSAIGTYASAGAALGPSFLWTAPVTLPMMFVVVFLSAKLGQVAGRGINPMKALVVAGVVQGFSTPPLMLLIMLTTNDRKVMGPWVNSRASNVLGWTTTVLIFAASAALVASWVM